MFPALELVPSHLHSTAAEPERLSEPWLCCNLSQLPGVIRGCSRRRGCVCWSLIGWSSLHKFPSEGRGFDVWGRLGSFPDLRGAAPPHWGQQGASPALHCCSLVLAEHSEVPLLETLLDLKCIIAHSCNRHKAKVLLWQEELLEILDLLRVVSSQSVSCGNEVCLHYPCCRLSAKWGCAVQRQFPAGRSLPGGPVLWGQLWGKALFLLVINQIQELCPALESLFLLAVPLVSLDKSDFSPGELLCLLRVGMGAGSHQLPLDPGAILTRGAIWL